MSGYELNYPPPEKILLQHPLFGDCYFVKENGQFVLRNANSGNAILTKGVDLTTTKFYHSAQRGNKVIYTFTIEMPNSSPVEIAVHDISKESAEKHIRAKLGLTQDTKLTFVRETHDVSTCSIEDLKNATIKKGGNDSVEAMQQNIGDQRLPGPRPIDSQENM